MLVREAPSTPAVGPASPTCTLGAPRPVVAATRAPGRLRAARAGDPPGVPARWRAGARRARAQPTPRVQGEPVAKFAAPWRGPGRGGGVGVAPRRAGRGVSRVDCGSRWSGRAVRAVRRSARRAHTAGPAAVVAPRAGRFTDRCGGAREEPAPGPIARHRAVCSGPLRKPPDSSRRRSPIPLPCGPPEALRKPWSCPGCRGVGWDGEDRAGRGPRARVTKRSGPRMGRAAPSVARAGVTGLRPGRDPGEGAARARDRARRRRDETRQRGRWRALGVWRRRGGKGTRRRCGPAGWLGAPAFGCVLGCDRERLRCAAGPRLVGAGLRAQAGAGSEHLASCGDAGARLRQVTVSLPRLGGAMRTRHPVVPCRVGLTRCVARRCVVRRRAQREPRVVTGPGASRGGVRVLRYAGRRATRPGGDVSLSGPAPRGARAAATLAGLEGGGTTHHGTQL